MPEKAKGNNLQSKKLLTATTFNQRICMRRKRHHRDNKQQPPVACRAHSSVTFLLSASSAMDDSSRVLRKRSSHSNTGGVHNTHISCKNSCDGHLREYRSEHERVDARCASFSHSVSSRRAKIFGAGLFFFPPHTRKNE